MNGMKSAALFDFSKSIAGAFLCGFEYPWQALPEIGDIVQKIGAALSEEEYYSPGENVWIHKSAKIYPSALICPPAIICEGAEVRHCAFIRGKVIVGKNCVVGNSTEMKNAVIFDNVQVPHYNYIGDSILGYKAHLGAGAVTSNVKSDKTNVTISFEGKKIETGLRKFGAMVGDYTEVGCNSVLNPGTVLGRGCIVYPTSSVRGYIGENSIFKTPDSIVEKRS